MSPREQPAHRPRGPVPEGAGEPEEAEGAAPLPPALRRGGAAAPPAEGEEAGRHRRRPAGLLPLLLKPSSGLCEAVCSLSEGVRPGAAESLHRTGSVDSVAAARVARLVGKSGNTPSFTCSYVESVIFKGPMTCH